MKASIELQSLVNDWADSYIKSVDLPVKILELAGKEGLTNPEIRKLIVNALLKRGLTDRRIRQIMPEELKFLQKSRDKTLRKTDEEIIAANAEDLEIESELENMKNLPVTTPDTIIMKSEGEIAEAQFLKDQKEEQYIEPKRAEVQQLIDNNILTQEQVLKWSNDQYTNTFQIPKDINITQGAYNARLSPVQVVTQIKQLFNSVKALEIGWRIIG